VGSLPNPLGCGMFRRILLVVMGIVAFGYSLYPVPTLQVRDLSGNRVLLSIPTSTGDQFGVSFINSVEKLPVTDYFCIDDRSRIIFSKIVYQAPYVGYIHEERVEVRGKDLVISGIHKAMERVTFFNGYSANHTLTFNGTSFPIHSMAPGGALIEIAVGMETRLTSLLGKGKIL
jgi:hypothetical protein